MSLRLRHIVFFLSVLTAAATSSAPCRAQDPEKAVAAASDFMNAIVRDSSLDNLMDLCGLPFCHDDSIMITTHAELRAALTQLLGASTRERIRTHPRVDTAYLLNSRKEVLFGLVPINVYFTAVNLKFSVGGKEASRLVILAVQLTDDAKVVGIQY